MVACGGEGADVNLHVGEGVSGAVNAPSPWAPELEELITPVDITSS